MSEGNDEDVHWERERRVCGRSRQGAFCSSEVGICRDGSDEMGGE